MGIWNKFQNAIHAKPQVTNVHQDANTNITLKPTASIRVFNEKYDGKAKKSGIFRSYCMKYKISYELPKNLDAITNSRFEFSHKMPVVKITATDTGRFILNDEMSIGKAVEDILSINGYINEAKKICPKLIHNQISKEYLHFAPQKAITSDQYGTVEYDLEYCSILFSPLTPSGKPAKFPYGLHFYEGLNMLSADAPVSTSGEIHYTQSGDIGKIRILEWRNKSCYIISCAIKDKMLQVSKIETFDMGGQEIVLFKL